MDVPAVNSLGPRYIHGSCRQPQHDSYGRRVPIWEALAIETHQIDKRAGKKQQWWKSILRRKESPGMVNDTQSAGDTLRKQSSWKWLPETVSWGSSKSAEKDDHSLSRCSSLSSDKDFTTSWKPVTLRLPVLGTMFSATLAMIAGLEILSYISMNNGNDGGLVFAKTVDDIPVGFSFVYLYLPTVIAVIYSMTWSWIDLDTKRLEPWFQLSKPSGATAEHSILLQYPFDFLALVPIKAARRRHWAVVIAGATMIFITWAIVPLQSAIFSTGIVSRAVSVQMATAGSLISPEAQMKVLDVNFMNRAYGVSWLDQKLPPFATEEYSLMPFKPVEEGIETFKGGEWSATTQMYYTNLTCTPAKFQREKPQHSWRFESQDGCQVREMNLLAPNNGIAQYIIHYIQYFDDAQVARALQNPNCTREHSHKFLAVWGENTNYTSPSDGNQYREWNNLTAIFCETSYYRRNVTATVAASDMAVIRVDYDALSAPESVGEDIFNVTHLHYTMGTGVTSIPTKGDLPNINVLEQYPRILNSSLQWPISAMTGFGIAMSDQDLGSFSDPAVIQTTFEKAHKLLFSMAMTFSTINATDTSGIRPGAFYDKPGSIILERTFALIVEAFLGLVAALTVALWLYYYRRPSNMVSDPASMSDIMKLVRSSRKLLHDFNDNGTVTAEVLAERVRDQRFRLRTSVMNGMPEMKLEAAGADSGFDDEKPPPFGRTQTIIDCPEQYKSIRPLEMKLMTGVLLALVVAGALSTVAVLYARILKYDGLQRPSDNAIVLGILENLVPTAFATLIEPFWVVLNRLLCILQPFEDLRNGNAHAKATVDAKYTAIPPQLAIWRAIRSGHVVLALVCLVAMSTNILAVALSGLFEESHTTTLIPIITTRTLSPVFNGTPSIRPGETGSNDGFIITYLDHYYVQLANAMVNGAAPLPAWIDKQYFYLPFDLSRLNSSDDEVRDLKLQGYEATTRGFGLDVKCSEVTHDPLPGTSDTLVFRTKLNGSRMLLFLNHTEENGDITICAPQGPFANDNAVYSAQNWTGDAQSVEFASSMIKYGEDPWVNRTSHYCSSLLLAGWVRAPAHTADDLVIPPVGDKKGLQELDLDYSFMTCKPSFSTAMFDIRVDAAGRVLSSNRSSEFDADLSSIAPAESIEAILQQATDLVVPLNSRSTKWHNDTLTTDWLNSLLKAYLNSSELIDPSAPAPNITAMIPVMEDMFQRLFPVALLGNLETFANEPVPAEQSVRIIAFETRIFMSSIMFWMTVGLLGLQLLVAAAYYIYRPRRFLPRMPLTIASVIAYVSASHAVHSKSADNSKHKGVRYGYGRFIGVDGQSHVGIEKEPLVVPLKADNPEFQRRRRSLFLRRKQDPTMPRTWI